jgi:hypothetical protein
MGECMLNKKILVFFTISLLLHTNVFSMQKSNKIQEKFNQSYYTPSNLLKFINRYLLITKKNLKIATLINLGIGAIGLAPRLYPINLEQCFLHQMSMDLEENKIKPTIDFEIEAQLLEELYDEINEYRIYNDLD